MRQAKAVFGLLFFAFSVFTTGAQNTYLPKDGYVPDSKTAIKIAEAVLLPIFSDKIYSERPFNATLIGDTVWIVNGTLPKPKKYRDGSVYIRYGGTAHVEIRKSDGKILNLYHPK